MKIEKIIIDDGDMFEGTEEQFRDCFFDNVSVASIKAWCEQNTIRNNYEIIFSDGTVLSNKKE